MNKLANRIMEGAGYIEVSCGNSAGNIWTQWVEKDMFRSFVDIHEKYDGTEYCLWSLPFGAARRWPSRKGHENFNVEALRKLLKGKNVIAWKYIPYPFK